MFELQHRVETLDWEMPLSTLRILDGMFVGLVG